MKVLTVQNIEGVAGSEKYFLALLPALIKQGVECEVYCVYKKQNLIKAQKFFDLLDELKIPYTLQEVKSYGSLRVPKKIARLVKNKNFDIVHTHLIYADFWGTILRKLFNKKVVIISTKHGYHEDTYVKFCNDAKNLPLNLYYRLFKFTHKGYQHSYACSYGLVDFYEKGGLIKKGSMDVIQHGFDYPRVEDFDQSNYRISDLQLVIWGRLIKRKGHAFVLDIMPELVKRHPQIQLVILGDGELDKELKQAVTDKHLNENVKFLGFQKEVHKYLVSSDIGLVPSYSEGLPLVIFEAFNAKLPVVTFDAIGCNELIKHEKTGLIAKAFSTEDLLLQIEKLIEQKELRKTYADSAFIELKNHFSLQRMVEETIAYYEKTINKSL